MWRVLNSVGRGLRSVRPSQCYPQDCSEDSITKYYDDISEVQAATQRHYSAASCWNPLIVKRNDNSLGGITCKSTQAVICYPSFSQVGEGIHTGSWDNDSPSTERTVGARYQPRCPPWHWQILQDNQNLEEHCSEKEKKEEKQSKQDWKKTCHFEEWKEVLHASPTLHALGWGSAAALTWSLFYGRSEHHSSQYQKNKKHHQVSCRDNKKLNPNLKDIKNQNNDNEETLIYHKPFKDLLTSHDSENHDEKSLAKIYEDINSQSSTYKPNLMKSYKCQTQEMVIPVYSLQHKSLEKLNKWFRTQANSSDKEEYRLEEIWYEDTQFDVNESSFFPEDKWFDGQEKTDSGCMSDCNQSFHSQTYSTKPEVPNHSEQIEENNVSRTVSDTISACDVLEASEHESTGEKDEHGSYQFREYHQPINNSSNNEIGVLCDRLIKIVKAHHEERLTNLVGKDKKTIFDTNPEEMIVYLQAGVLMGDTISAFNLALCYHMGHGITQDLEKARKLYEVASAAGHGWATYNLAVMLIQESEGPLMAPKAHSLLLQAAKLGVKEAEDALSALIEEEEQQKIQHKDEAVLRRCSSEPSLFSFPTKEWPYSYSTSDLQSLLDEDYASVEDFSSVVKVAQKI